MTNTFGIKRVCAFVFELLHLKKSFIFGLPSLAPFFQGETRHETNLYMFLPHTHTPIAFSARFKMQQLQSNAYDLSQHDALTLKTGHHSM